MGLALYWGMSQNTINNKKTIWAWCMYDWANSVFALVVMTAFFPLQLSGMWASDATGGKTTVVYGFANSIISAIIVLVAPVIGTLADRKQAKNRFLRVAAVLGALATAGLYFVGEGQWQWALALFGLGAVCFGAGNGLYDSLLVDIADGHERDTASVKGYSYGYFGSLILFVVLIAAFLKPSIFGMSKSSEVISIAFLAAGIWWLIFSLPTLLIVKDKDDFTGESTGHVVKDSFRDIWHTIHELKANRPLAIFFVAYILYIDGVLTIIKMAVPFAKDLKLEGLTDQSMIVAIAVTQLVGAFATLAYIKFSKSFGVRRCLIAGVIGYIGIVFWALQMNSAIEFYILAALVGLFMGGIQSLSRSYFSKAIPQGSAGRYFGFYNMAGKFAAIIGPALVAGTAMIAGTRWSIISLLLLFGGGLFFLTRLKDEEKA
jgi:UMF1 family MFS transporter